MTRFKQDITPKCRHCGEDALITKVDGDGDYQICRECGLRQDGLAELQKRFKLF